jgi:pimeloyl-ACP methyl ester carboxylesterase
MWTPVHGKNVYAYSGARDFDRAQPTVIFVHGASNDHSVWALQSRYIAHHGSNVVAIDLPGHGRSEGAPLHSVERIADWIVALLDAIDVERAALVGHSLGALAALDAAARHVPRVSRIALLGPSVPMPVADVLLDTARQDDHVAFELIIGWSFSPDHLLGGNRLPGVWMAGNALRLMERSRPGVLYTDLLACHRYERGLDAAARVVCPSLLLIGERDQMAPPANAAGLIEALTDRTVVALPGCGHSMMTEAPDEVLDALRTFLADDSSGGPKQPLGVLL